MIELFENQVFAGIVTGISVATISSFATIIGIRKDWIKIKLDDAVANRRIDLDGKKIDSESNKLDAESKKTEGDLINSLIDASKKIIDMYQDDAERKILEVEKYEKAIADLNKKVAEQSRAIRELTKKIDERDEQIESLIAELRERDGRIEELLKRS